MTRTRSCDVCNKSKNVWSHVWPAPMLNALLALLALLSWSMTLEKPREVWRCCRNRYACKMQHAKGNEEHINCFSALKQTHCAVSYVILNEWLAFCSTFLISSEVEYLQCFMVATWLVPCETAAVSAWSVYTIQPRTMSCHFMQCHM